MNAMPGDTSRTRIHIGELYFQWDSKDRHYLVLDLTGPLPEWVVEAGGAIVPLEEYLGRHPGRREEVRQQIRGRLLTPGRREGPADPQQGTE
jgi:hypothetical protein